ncbi:hypothetical protein Cme02nite_03790 [Catellatospora methionotrophica]|uniref:Uncharacterized protein n=1 Tax=Catellatospora methionotrophica TaxID=121620 RepID=A0A8J3PCI3_9ACTN|nr:hypothetical protein [Catellatospora methionotrophica]GIG12047.1 hypothetical protein Cme02nite_03790 [Catellatospora methionotrophica]
MATMTRSTALKIAATLSVVVAIIGIAMFDLPNLTLGAQHSRDPFAIVLGSFASDILALVAAYGAWRTQKWGAVLLVGVNMFWLVQAIGSLLLDTSLGETVFASVMLVHHLVVITLCLWRERVASAV